MKLGLLVIRVILGALFVGHGTQKLFGWFGGHGIEGTAGFMEALGLRPGRDHAIAAGVAEAGGGALLTAGLATPVAAAAITGSMATAVRTVHAPKGPWIAEGGYEYNLVIVATLLAIVDVGPGDLSLDHALGTERRGPFWAVAAVAAGIGASHAVLTRAQAHEQAPAETGQPGETPAQTAPAGA
jgi:putative oxidoreductase